MKYEEPKMEVILLDTRDIQTLLNSGGTVDEGGMPDSGVES